MRLYAGRIERANMPQLVLVKHSNSDHNPLQPAADWPLTAEGLRRCHPLAQHLKPYQAKRLYSSPMPKARQTAQRVALELTRCPSANVPFIAEHTDNQNAPYGSASGIPFADEPTVRRAK